MKRPIAYDTETTGLNVHGADRMFAWSTCNRAGETTVQRDAKPIFDASRRVVMHNAKFDLLFSEKALGRGLDDVEIECTHKMSHVLQNDRLSHALDDVAHDLAGYEKVDDAVKRLAVKAGGFDKVPEEIMDRYQRKDVERTMALFLFFEEKLREVPAWWDCYRTEVDLIRPTMRMEQRGIMLHEDRTRRMVAELEERCDHLRESINAAADRRINPRAATQVRDLLYRQLGLPVLGYTEKAGDPSIDKTILGELYDRTKLQVIDDILAFNSYSRGSAMLKSYLQLADDDWTIHPSINTCAAKTSRESCSHPNLQNVQKAGVLLTKHGVPARMAFRPRPGYVNIHIDYSGVEMRLIIHYAQDPAMIHCVNHGDGDVHALAARVFYGRRFEEARGAERKTLRGAAKNANFSIPYGAAPAKVAEILGMRESEGARVISRYREAFPSVASFASDQLGDARALGYVETTFGRRLYVPWDIAHAAANYRIQGTAAGIIKRGQIRVHDYNQRATSGEVRLLLPVHDELIIEYPRARMGELPGYLRDVRRLLIDFPQFSVPLDVEAELSTASWAEKTEMEIIR